MGTDCLFGRFPHFLLSSTVQQISKLLLLRFPLVYSMHTRLEVVDATETQGNFSAIPEAVASFQRPVRAVLAATSWEDACARSQNSAPHGKRITKQVWNILDKIGEVDTLLQSRSELRKVVREVHPEVCFRELVGRPMAYRKARVAGRDERRRALMPLFPNLDMIEKSGRDQGLPIEDILDAVVACWSAGRLANGDARSFPETGRSDATGLPMLIRV